ncbi:uncharacterized protein LOC120428955 [Culex pipiens pallens]|uniref:uncharacterized protein LOC120428955 n=1 Tax=Culex pipiens pallens TaxID=42434 RepID=UPI00195404A1|nr:uncharacterized protein LOC120428955 [Culex pipiens pallens]
MVRRRSHKEEDDEKRDNRRWPERMLHSVPAVYYTANNRPQMLISRRRSSSRMNLTACRKNLCHSRERMKFRGPHQPNVPDALPESETPCSGTSLSNRETSITLAESTANFSKPVLMKAGNVTIMFSTLLSRVETSIRNRPAWGLRK